MDRKNFILIRIFFIVLVLFIFSLVLPFGFLKAEEVPTFHQFYGKIFDGNGSFIDEDVSVVLRINDSEVGSTVSNGSLYGYFPSLLFASNGGDDDEVEFYVYGILSGSFIFENGETSNFDLNWPCGNGILDKDLGERCDGTNISSDLSCTDYGFSSGSLVCNSHCKISTADCVFGGSPVGTTTTGGPGGDSIGGTVPSCDVNWICSEWGACLNSIQVRKCIDENDCGNSSSKPSEERECIGVEDLDDDNTVVLGSGPDKGKRISVFDFVVRYWYIPVLVLAILILLIFILRKYRHYKRVQNFKSSVSSRGWMMPSSQNPDSSQT